MADEGQPECLQRVADEWRLIIDNLKEGVLLLDSNQRILRANRPAAGLLGLESGQMVGRPCYELFHGTETPPEYCPFTRAGETEAKAVFYEPFLKRHLSVTVVPLSGEGDGYYLHTVCDVTKNKDLERRYRNSRKTLKGVLQFSPFPILVLNRDYTFRYLNPEAERLVGVSSSEAAGRHCYEVVHQRGDVCEGCRLGEAIRNRSPVWEEKRVMGRDGKDRYIERVFYPVLDAEGEVEAVVEVIKDVTELKEKERKLKESEAFLRSVLEGIGDAVLVIDPKMRILMANRGFLRQVKMPLQDVIGSPCYEVSHQFTRPCYEKGEDCTVRKAYQDGRHHSSLHIHRQKNGTPIYVETNAYPLKDEEGEVKAVVETISDVTEKVKLQKRLEESERRYRLLYHSAPTMMLSLSMEGKVIECNETTLKVLGLEAPELLGRAFVDLLSGESSEVYESRCGELLQRGHCKTELRLRRSGGGEVVALVKAVLLRDEKGIPLKVNITMTDITELRRLQREREALREQLFQAQKMEALGTLAAGIAHDFNNMLQGIMGFAELLQKRVDDPLRPYVDRIIAVTERARDLTNQILILGRRSTISMSPVELNGFVRESLSTIRRMVEENIEIETALAEEHLWCMADRGQLYQVLLNLVVNARDAVPREGGRILIKTGRSERPCLTGRPYRCVLESEGRSEGYVWFSVEDNGTGIPAEALPRLFDPFFTTKEPEGTGLGLAVVHSIVQAHGGCIDLWTEEGRGTEIVILLPHSEERTTDSGPAGEVQRILRTGSVMIVEDEEVVRDILGFYFREEGWQVKEFSRPSDALQEYRMNPQGYDLLVVDWVMPDISGEAMVTGILEANPSQRIVICTGYAEGEEIFRLQQRPNVRVLRKPFKKEDILELIKGW